MRIGVAEGEVVESLHVDIEESVDVPPMIIRHALDERRSVQLHQDGLIGLLRFATVEACLLAARSVSRPTYRRRSCAWHRIR